MFGGPVASRPMGVLVPDNTSTEQAPQQKLVNFSFCQFAAVEFGDAEGRKHSTVLMHMGGQWYFPPNGESWANVLKPAAEWLAKQLNEAAKNATPADADVPKADAVNVIPQKAGSK